MIRIPALMLPRFCTILYIVLKFQNFCGNASGVSNRSFLCPVVALPLTLAPHCHDRHDWVVLPHEGHHGVLEAHHHRRVQQDVERNDGRDADVVRPVGARPSASSNV